MILPWSLGALVNVTAAARVRARQDLVARTAAAERLRLAGEVHDVAGHGFALVAMHAGVALLVLDERPTRHAPRWRRSRRPATRLWPA